jgi:antitoxin component of RelBE/YafQ-DinJ toxin-antitoxin module/lambda repressor-like predicted transcriptional regulator
MNTQASRRLLTFRLDQEQRQRIRARLAREGRTMSEVVTHGLRQYVQAALPRGDDPPQTPPDYGGAVRPPVPPRPVPPRPVPPRLPERVAARLRELRSSGRSDLLSATLAALNEAGWPLRPLAEALGISRQAVQARVRRRAPAGLREHVVASEIVHFEPPPPFPQRRVASAAGLRPHLTIKIDHTLRASAHRAAADEGSSLTQVVEAILDRYLRNGMADRDQAPREASRSR